MTNTVRGLLAVSALAGALVAAPAFAQDDNYGLSVSGNVALVTDYRFRGVSQTNGDPAVQGSVEVKHTSGLYVGAFSSSITGGAVRGSQELDLYAGYSREVLPGLTADLGINYYAFPGGHVGKAEFFEPYVSVAKTYGPARVKLGLNYGWNQTALGNDDNIYGYSDLDVAVPTTPLTLTAHAGYRDGVLAAPAYTGPRKDHGWDYSVGASATVLGKLTLGVKYVGVEGPVVNRATDDQVVGTLSVAF